MDNQYIILGTSAVLGAYFCIGWRMATRDTAIEMYNIGLIEEEPNIYNCGRLVKEMKEKVEKATQKDMASKRPQRVEMWKKILSE